MCLGNVVYHNVYIKTTECISIQGPCTHLRDQIARTVLWAWSPPFRAPVSSVAYRGVNVRESSRIWGVSGVVLVPRCQVTAVASSGGEECGEHNGESESCEWQRLRRYSRANAETCYWEAGVCLA